MANELILSKNNKYRIKYFVFVFFILPTLQVSGLSSVVSRFIPNPLGYNMLAFILSLPLLRSFNKKYGNLGGVVLATGLVGIYVLATFFKTASDTSFFAALTVFRYSFMQVLH